MRLTRHMNERSDNTLESGKTDNLGARESSLG